MILIEIMIIEALHDELGMCRTSLVSPEQPVLCIPVGRLRETMYVKQG